MKLRHALRGTAAGLLLAVCLTTPTLALTGVVDVGGSVLRVRKTASTGSAVLDQLPSGKQVEIVDTATNGWYGIQLGSVKGYVSASYIKLLEEAGAIVVLKPRRMAPKAPTVCTSLHTLSQRLQNIHLSIFRTMDEVTSRLRGESSPPL